MKLPYRPPAIPPLAIEAGSDLLRILKAVPLPTVKGRYVHWNKLVHYPAPEGLTHKQWWLGLKIRRGSTEKNVPLTDRQGRPFTYAFTDPLHENLHALDKGAGGTVEVPREVVNPVTRDRYYLQSLTEEAIASSQLEGATTTRRVAKEMLLAQRKPRDKSEQMILNNFLAMRRIGELRNQELTKELVFDLHRQVTQHTLDDASANGRFRRLDEDIVLQDPEGRILHRPPASEELEARMAAMCDFANGTTPDEFLHPALRAIMLHFWLAYDHPFVDGNGRTARALFYWCMLRNGYWLFEFVSISRLLKAAPSRYARAFLYTETDNNDLTYFLTDQLDIIRRSMADLNSYLERKRSQVAELDAAVRSSHFNPRQKALLSHAIRHGEIAYSIEGHRVRHNTVYQTARTDLLSLVERRLLTMAKKGRAWEFHPVEDLERRLKTLED